MNAEICWVLFLETGMPVFYLLYRMLTEAEDASQSA